MTGQHKDEASQSISQRTKGGECICGLSLGGPMQSYSIRHPKLVTEGLHWQPLLVRGACISTSSGPLTCFGVFQWGPACLSPHASTDEGRVPWWGWPLKPSGYWVSFNPKRDGPYLRGCLSLFLKNQKKMPETHYFPITGVQWAPES